MNNIHIIILLLQVALLMPTLATAHNFEVNGIYYNFNGNEATVTNSNQGDNLYSGHVTIPATVTYNDTIYSVTAIESCAFFSCSELTSITIPNSVTYIGENAFFECCGLNCINIPDSITSIEPSTFFGCSGLTSIIIPNSVTSIGNGAFNNCSGLTNIDIPNSVTRIGDYCFSGCSSLTGVTAFCDIGSYAFYYCSNLRSANIGSVGECAFNECHNLTDVVVDGAIIGNSAFEDCSNLKNVTLNNTREIGLYSFSGCPYLTTITIPKTIASIYDWAFGETCNLTEIYCLAVQPPHMLNAFVPFSAVLYVPKESINAYREVEGWNNFTNIIGIGSVLPGTIFEVDGIYYHSISDNMASVIANSEAEGYYNGNVVIPDSVIHEGQTFSVTGIENNAFDDCAELTSVVIGDSVTGIGEQAFQGCTALSNVTFGNKVANIGAKAFNNCNALQSVTCKGSVPPVMANSNCFSLTAYRNAVLKVPRKEAEAYSATDYWYKFEHIEGFGPIGPGDVNADGVISITDVTALIGMVLGSAEYNADADLNNNGKLDIGDVTSIIVFVLSM